MSKLHSFKKILFHILVVATVISLHAPVYHQHVDDYHPAPIKHSDAVEHHHPGDYSVHSRMTTFLQEVLRDKPHQTHYHLHIDNHTYRNIRIYESKSKAASFQSLVAINSRGANTPVNQIWSYDYRPIYYSNHSAKTSSGLSPPRYSV